MNIPEELICYYTVTYFNIDKALHVLPFILNKYQRNYIKTLHSKYTIILRFMKKTYLKLYNKICNRRLAVFICKEEEWFTEIIVSTLSLGLYLRDLQTMLAHEFSKYTHLIDDIHRYKKCLTMKNVKKTKIMIGPSISNWYNKFEYFHVNLLSRVYTPKSIHRIYPVRFGLARKIEKSKLLKGLLF